MAKNKALEELENEIEEDLQEEVEGVPSPAAVENDGLQDDGPVDEDGNPVLFVGGPDMNLVEEWKARFGEIYLTEFDELVIVWRPINRKEYKSAMTIQGADQFYREEKLCEMAILWPLNYGFANLRNGKAGVPSVLSDIVLEKSGFTPKTGAIRI